MIKQDTFNPKIGFKPVSDADGLYNTDNILDAINYGKGLMVDGIAKNIITIFRSNVDKAHKLTSTLMQQMHDKGFKPENALYKISGLDRFDVMIIVPVEDHASDAFLDIYSDSMELAISNNQDGYYIDFHFIASSEKINWGLINADGYKYAHKPQETTRQA
jgi:hypothetical protein